MKVSDPEAWKDWWQPALFQKTHVESSPALEGIPVQQPRAALTNTS